MEKTEQEMEKRNGYSSPSTRIPLKTLNCHKLDKHSLNLNWKQKLRESCYKRVKEDRARLLWTVRLPLDRSHDEKEVIKSAFQDIVADELKKLDKFSDDLDIPTSNTLMDDELWEYNGPQKVYEGEHEEILLEMQRIFYEDLKAEEAGREQESSTVWEEEEDDYLAHAFFQYMQLNDELEHKERTWCPICKRGELLENHQLIYCGLCPFNLSRGNEVNLGLLRARLAEAHEEHLNRGCGSKPEFSVETIFDLTALYICCQNCNIFEVVL
ncbi:hypothetical protein Dimus_016916 [Dionaea muscipula]